MMRNHFIRITFLTVLLFGSSMASGVIAYYGLPWYYHLIAGAVFAVCNVIPSVVKRPSIKLRILSDGTDLLCAFLALLFVDTAFVLSMSIAVFGMFSTMFWNYVILMLFAENTVFWNGIIRVYCTGTMIGMKWRLIGLFCGMMPIVNIIVLLKIISLGRMEVDGEEQREKRDRERHDDRVCATKYPLLLVHGVFFRDLEKFNYWGRVPEELIRNGATIYYGEQQSALNIEDSAKELARRIKEVIDETGSEKLNIIAHSKGGLDSRYALSVLGCDQYVASLTTINTPHRGCAFADWLLDTAPEGLRQKLAFAYNTGAAVAGDTSPDFLAAVNDLRATRCKEFNEKVINCPGVYYQSVGSKINKPMRNVFPLNFSYLFAKTFDGDNDGLVAVKSAEWGDNFTYLKSRAPDGLSHADMIDLMRRDKPDFDVREFYVQLVSDLKAKGF